MAAISTAVHLRNNEDPSLVYLNVYDVNPAGVSNPFFRWLGLGSTLSCVQVQGHEFMFGEQGGVMNTCLMNAPTRSTLVGLRHSILVGRTQFDEAGVRETVQQLRRNGEYTAASYNLFTNNCHHFSDRLCRRLTGGHRIPWWANPIIATFGLFSRCLLPGDDGHEPNSADNQEWNIADHDNGDADNDGARNDHDGHGDADEEHHDDGDHDTDDDHDDAEPQ